MSYPRSKNWPPERRPHQPAPRGLPAVKECAALRAAAVASDIGWPLRAARGCAEERSRTVVRRAPQAQDRAAQPASRCRWRRGVGVEPTQRRMAPFTGFEVRPIHRGRCLSVVGVCGVHGGWAAVAVVWPSSSMNSWQSFRRRWASPTRRSSPTLSKNSSTWMARLRPRPLRSRNSAAFTSPSAADSRAILARAWIAGGAWYRSFTTWNSSPRWASRASVVRTSASGSPASLARSRAQTPSKPAASSRGMTF